MGGDAQSEEVSDMPDPTVGHSFVFRARPLGSNQDVEYHLKRTNTGWEFDDQDSGGACDKAGRPFLTYRLAHDLAGDPLLLADRMERLWLRAWKGRLPAEQVQGALDELSRWMRLVNENAPRGSVWEQTR
jgi:hypothetical protein